MSTCVRSMCSAGLLVLAGCSQQSDRQPLQSAGDQGVIDHAPPDAVLRVASRGEPVDSGQLFAKRIVEVDARVKSDLESFLAESGAAPVVLDFDDVPAGSNMETTTVVDGVSFQATAAALIVVRADETWMPATYSNVPDTSPYQLVATTGAQVLSPGGPELAPGTNAALEDDDIRIVFDPPVAAVGFDLLTTSADGMSFTDITVIDINGVVLYVGRMHGAQAEAHASAFPLPGASFWGFVADACVIHEVRVDEMDDNADCPDANIGIDSMRFAPAASRRAIDFNGDGVIDDADLRILTDDWRAWEQDEKAASRWWRTDINRDRRVDADDMVAFVTAAESLGD